jgi:tripartite-type tricarboxylate transporter receptor subunit TctC
MKAKKVMKRSLVLLATAILFFGFALHQAQAAYPDKPITFIVPFGAGGGFDTLARALSTRLEKELAVPFAIKNEGGAGGRRGSISLYKSKPDGYTIGFAHFVSLQTDEALLKKKSPINYKNFKIILKISHSRHYLYVNKKSPFMTITDLKKAGRTIKFSGTGVGAITWIEAQAVGTEVGFPAKVVTGYKSLAEAALATARGEVDASLGSYHHFHGVIKDLRPLVYLSKTRWHGLPDVPTIQELGYPRLAVLGSPRVVCAPPGTPDGRLEVIRNALRKILDSQEFKDWAKEAGYSLDPMGPSELWENLKINADIYRTLEPLLQTK